MTNPNQPHHEVEYHSSENASTPVDPYAPVDYPAGYPPVPGLPPPDYPQPAAAYPGYPPTYPGYPQAYPGGYPSPYAGYPGDPYDPYRQTRPPGTNGIAIAALITSLAGLLCCGLPSIAGVILGIIAMQETRRTGQDGHGLALAGVIVGGLIVGLVVVCVFVGVVRPAASS
jgi:hypothetical protein